MAKETAKRTKAKSHRVRVMGHRIARERKGVSSTGRRPSPSAEEMAFSTDDETPARPRVTSEDRLPGLEPAGFAGRPLPGHCLHLRPVPGHLHRARSRTDRLAPELRAMGKDA